MMDIHHTYIYDWHPYVIHDGHPSYSLMMDIHNIWRLSYMTDVHHIWRTLTIYDHHHNLLSNSNSDAYTFLSGPSLASKPLQEHKLIIMMELHHCWLSSTLLFIFQIKIYNCKIDSSHDKWNFWNPVAKIDIDPETGCLWGSPLTWDPVLGYIHPAFVISSWHVFWLAFFVTPWKVFLVKVCCSTKYI